MCEINTPSNSLLGSKWTILSFLACWLSKHYSRIDRATLSLFLVHSSINELGLFNPLLICPYRLALKSKIVLEVSNISVVHDFLNMFSEVLLGCHLTAMLSS